MRECGLWQYCETNFEERGAGNPHATICGGGSYVNSSFYPAAGYTIRASSSSDGGATWSAAVNISNPAEYSTTPLVSLNDAGQAVIVWVDDGNSTVLSSYSVNSGSSWSVEATLSPGGQLCVGSAVSMNASGQAVVTWDNNSNNLIQAVYSTNGGVTWLSAAQAISLSVTGTNQNAQVAINDSNRSVATWTKFDGSNFLAKASFSTDGGVSWLSPSSIYTLSAAGGTSDSTRLVLNSTGWAIATWYRTGDGPHRIQVNNDYNISSLQAERQKVRFPLTIDLIDQISWNDMPNATNYKVYSDAALTQVLGSYAGSSLFFEHQMKRGNIRNYYFTVTAGGIESSAVKVELP